MFAVDCNDRLYGHDRKYLAEVNKMADTLLDEVLNQLQLLDKPEVKWTNYTAEETSKFFSLIEHQYPCRLFMMFSNFLTYFREIK